MNAKLNIPETIKVGFQERKDTYSGLLAYVVYLKSDGTIAKEKSWRGWCSKKIDIKEIPNEPTEGFVLNKRAGGYASGWNHRQTYCRVWDPRGWEVEISIENLLYILQECNCDKGKGLEGKFIYSWDGKDLILLPTHSQDYKESLEFNKKRKEIKISNLVVGNSYMHNNDKSYVYIGPEYLHNIHLGRIKYHIFYDGKEEIKLFTKLGKNTFSYMDKEKVMSLADCADIIDKVKDHTEWKDYGKEIVPIKIEIANFKSNLLECVIKLQEDYKNYHLSLWNYFLENPTRERYDEICNKSYYYKGNKFIVTTIDLKRYVFRLGNWYGSFPSFYTDLDFNEFVDYLTGKSEELERNHLIKYKNYSPDPIIDFETSYITNLSHNVVCMSKTDTYYRYHDKRVLEDLKTLDYFSIDNKLKITWSNGIEDIREFNENYTNRWFIKSNELCIQIN